MYFCTGVCVSVCKGWDGITLGLGREHGSGCLIDRSHLESIGRSLAGQRRDTHNQRLLTHTKTNHRECGRRQGGLRANVSMPSVLRGCMESVLCFNTRKANMRVNSEVLLLFNS